MCFFLVVFFAFFFKNPLLSAGRMRFLKIKKKNKKKQKKTKKKLDQFLTYKKGNLGPVFNSTAYIYMYCRVKSWSKHGLFGGQNLVQIFSFFPFSFFNNRLLSAGRMRF